jgi:hypothetical protein
MWTIQEEEDDEVRHGSAMMLRRISSLRLVSLAADVDFEQTSCPLLRRQQEDDDGIDENIVSHVYCQASLSCSSLSSYSTDDDEAVDDVDDDEIVSQLYRPASFTCSSLSSSTQRRPLRPPLQQQVVRPTMAKIIVGLIHLICSLIYILGMLRPDGWVRKLLVDTSFTWFETDNDDHEDTDCRLRVCFFALFTSMVFFVGSVLWIPSSWSAIALGWLFAKIFLMGSGDPSSLIPVTSSCISSNTTSLGAPIVVILLSTLVVTVGASANAMVSFLLGQFYFQGTWHLLVSRSRNKIGMYQQNIDTKRRFRRIRRPPSMVEWTMSPPTTSSSGTLMGGETATMSFLVALDQCCRAETSSLPLLIILRLSPILPFTLLNYWAGATPLSLMIYAKSLVAMVPGMVLFVAWGMSFALDAAADKMVTDDDGGEDRDENEYSVNVTGVDDEGDGDFERINTTRCVIIVMGALLSILATLIAVWFVQGEQEEGMLRQWKQRRYQLDLAQRRTRMRHNSGREDIDDWQDETIDNSGRRANGSEEGESMWFHHDVHQGLGRIDEEEDEDEDEILFTTIASHHYNKAEHEDNALASWHPPIRNSSRPSPGSSSLFPLDIEGDTSFLLSHP